MAAPSHANLEQFRSQSLRQGRSGIQNAWRAYAQGCPKKDDMVSQSPAVRATETRGGINHVSTSYMSVHTTRRVHYNCISGTPWRTQLPTRRRTRPSARVPNEESRRLLIHIQTPWKTPLAEQEDKSQCLIRQFSVGLHQNRISRPPICVIFDWRVASTKPIESRIESMQRVATVGTVRLLPK